MKNIVETRICKCGATFNITRDDLDFREQISPSFPSLDPAESGLKKYLIPNPTLCPLCRNQRRLAFRNERNIYKRNCDATGKTILSVFSPDKQYKVYEHSVWAGDSWDGIDYGRDYDFSRSFFEQYDELLKEVPHQSIFAVNCENSDYAQMINGKNDYLTFVGINAEDTHYSHWMVNTKDCVDCLRCQDLTLGYDCVHCYENCYSLKSCFNCKSTANSSFCFNLNGCKDCFMSGNLSNKQYVFKNTQLSKDQYTKELLNAKMTENYPELRKEMVNLMKSGIQRANQNFNSENVSGDFIKNSKNMENCYEVDESEDCKDFYDNAGFCKNCRDATYGWQSENCYEVLGADGNHNIFGMLNIFGTNDTIYTFASYYCHDLFGCACLKNKEYCILNKQYTKEEYEALVPKIIESMMLPHPSSPKPRGGGEVGGVDEVGGTTEWGEFFPASISPYGYNESAAFDHYQMGKSEALEKGFKWSEYENPRPDVSKIIPGEKLPRNIADVPDDILNWAVECEVTAKPFRIIRQELDFYRKLSLPIPTKHPDQRHIERVNLRNPRILHDRNCDKCGVDIKTSYSPDRSEIIYCEKCYENVIL